MQIILNRTRMKVFVHTDRVSKFHKRFSNYFGIPVRTPLLPRKFPKIWVRNDVYQFRLI